MVDLTEAPPLPSTESAINVAPTAKFDELPVKMGRTLKKGGLADFLLNRVLSHEEPQTSTAEAAAIKVNKKDLFNSALALLSRGETHKRRVLGLGSKRIFHETVMGNDGEKMPITIAGNSNLSTESTRGTVDVMIPGVGRIRLNSGYTGIDVTVRESRTDLYHVANQKQLKMLNGIFDFLKQSDQEDSSERPGQEGRPKQAA